MTQLGGGAGGASGKVFARPIALRGALETAENMGADTDEILTAVGLSSEAMASNDALVESGKVADAYEVAARLTGMPDFGLRAGLQIKAGSFGAVGLVIERAATAADALRNIVRFVHLLNEAISASFERVADGYVVRTSSIPLGQFPPVQYAETLPAVMIAVLRNALGAGWAPVEVSFAHAPVAAVSSYQALLGCPVSFHAPATSFLATAEDVERPLKKGNALVRNMAMELMQEIDRTRTKDLVTRAHALLRSMIPQGYTSVGDLASALDLTERTLQRRLGEQHTSFTQALISMRREIVLRNVEHGKTSAAALCVPLGLSDASAASRFLREHCSDIWPSGGVSRKAKPDEKMS